MGDGLRCTSDGGNVPVLSVSVGAYPDQIGNSYEYSTNSNIYQRSGLLGRLWETQAIHATMVL